MHIHLGCLQSVDMLLNLQEIAAANQLIYRTHTELCHIFPHFLCNKVHEIDNVFRFSAEILAQLWILCGYANRAGIQIADTHHDTAHRDQRRCRKAVFLRTQHGSDHNITATHQLTVCLDPYLVTQVVADQGLVGLGQTDLPRQTGIVDRASRCRTCTTVITGDQDNLCTGLGNTGSDCSDTGLGYQLDRNSRIFIGIFQIIDQLRQILDRIDIVMRRRRDQGYTRGRISGLCNPRIHLSARQMTALTRFSALRHLDLYLFGTDKVTARYAKTSGGYLLDRRTAVFTVSARIQTARFLSALTTVGLAVDGVHGQSQRLMGFLGNRTVGHRTCFETGHNGIHALNLLDRDTLLRIFESQQVTQRTLAVLGINLCRIFFKLAVIPCSGGFLQQMDRQRIVQMLLTAASHLVTADAVQRQITVKAQRIKGLIVQIVDLILDIPQCDTADTADCIGKIFVDHRFINTDGLKDLRTHIGLDRGNTHLGSNLYDTADNSLVIIVDSGIVILFQHAGLDQIVDGFVCQIRVDCAGTIAEQCGKMMHLTRLTGFQDHGKGGSFSRINQMMMYGRYCQQRRDSHMVLIHATVRQDDDIHTVSVGTVNLDKQTVDRLFQTGVFIIYQR